MDNIILTTVPLETIEERFSKVVDQKLQALLAQLQLPTKQPQFITRKDAAKKLGISLVTLNEWTKTGIVTGYRIASRVRYKEDEIEAALIRMKTSYNAA